MKNFSNLTKKKCVYNSFCVVKCKINMCTQLPPNIEIWRNSSGHITNVTGMLIPALHWLADVLDFTYEFYGLIFLNKSKIISLILHPIVDLNLIKMAFYLYLLKIEEKINLEWPVFC